MRAAIFIVLVAQLGTTSAKAASGFIYDHFVRECEKSGGRVGTTRAEADAGARFVCDRGGASTSGASTRLPPKTAPPAPRSCEHEVPANVNWVFADRGAQARYRNGLYNGLDPFEAVVRAQGHNPPVQEMLRRCGRIARDYVANRVAGRVPGADRTPTVPPDEMRLPLRPPTAADCGCISVIPAVSTANGRPTYRVSNRCSYALEVSASFSGDTLPFGARVDAFTSSARAGILGEGDGVTVSPPEGWTVNNIAAVGLRTRGGRLNCPF
ncbi:hypothetical protein BY998_1369 [Methylobacterium sp. B4]|nr:hypothetical protein BY998_1369 [Methylobacterium sp. B4]